MSSVQEKLNRLFDAMHARDEPAMSNAAAAEGITRRTGIVISPEDLERLRAGASHEVSTQQLTAVAEFFGVPADYLTDSSEDAMVNAQLNLLEAMRDSGIRDLHACRVPQPPTPDAINALANTINQLS
jgi:hypothetical protein